MDTSSDSRLSDQTPLANVRICFGVATTTPTSTVLRPSVTLTVHFGVVGVVRQHECDRHRSIPALDDAVDLGDDRANPVTALEIARRSALDGEYCPMLGLLEDLLSNWSGIPDSNRRPSA